MTGIFLFEDLARLDEYALAEGPVPAAVQSRPRLHAPPDVVIVKDPLKPPTQDNIKQVVEMKFPDDEYRPRQREDYIVIAGDESKMVPLELKDCDCNQREPDKSKVPVEQLCPAPRFLT